MSKIKYILFDMDGVLIDSMGCHINSLIKAFNKYKVPVTKTDFENLAGVSFKDSIQTLAEKYSVDLDEKQRKELFEYKVKLFNESFELRAYAGVIEGVNELKSRGIKLALVTGSNKRFTNSVVQELFKEIFDVIVTNDDVIKGKPAPDGYEKARADMGAQSQECVVVEDAIMGLRAGKAAKIRVIGITTTMKRDDLKEADLVVNDHKELFDYLLKNS